LLLALLAGLALSSDVNKDVTCPNQSPHHIGFLKDQPDPQCFASPDGRNHIWVQQGHVQLNTAKHSFSMGVIDGGQIIWSPNSNGFVLANNEGSKDTELFSYFDLNSGKPRLINRLRQIGLSEFFKHYKCGGKDVNANSITDGFTNEGKVRLVIQASVHSKGCQVSDDYMMIGLIGNPVTGQIDTVLKADEVRSQWCTPDQKTHYGYCYDEAAFKEMLKAKPKTDKPKS